MAKNPVALNDKQIAVLLWVLDGCPEGTWEGTDYRIVARALERRGLVTITGRGSTWKVQLTDAGRTWKQPRPEAGVLPGTAVELIEALLAAGGRLEYEDSYGLRRSLEAKVKATLRAPNRPHGQQVKLSHEGSWMDRKDVIVLVPYLGDDVDHAPVRVPAAVRQYHPVAKAYLANKDGHWVSQPHLARAARIMNAIAVEAPKRGLTVSEPKRPRRQNGYADGDKFGGAQMVLQGAIGRYGLQVREVAGPGATLLEPIPWTQRDRRPEWIRKRNYEFISTGRLELVITGPKMPYDGRRLRDAKTVQLEDKLGEVFSSIELAEREAVQAGEDAERELRARERRWEIAVAQAREDYLAAARLQSVLDHADQWERVDKARRFLVAVATEYARGERTDFGIDAFIVNANSALDALDPLRDLSVLLKEPNEPSARDLEPFLARPRQYESIY